MIVVPGRSQAAADRRTTHSVAGGRFIVPMQDRTKVFCALPTPKRSVSSSGIQAATTSSFIKSKVCRNTSGAIQRLAFRAYTMSPMVMTRLSSMYLTTSTWYRSGPW